MSQNTSRIDPKEIYKYLLAKGVSTAAAQGILANIKYESQFNPTAVGDNGMSFGLFQHYDTRRQALMNYARRQGKHHSDWQTQVDYALVEAKLRGGNLRHDDPVAFSQWWTEKWEIPANAEVKSKLRAKSVGEFAYKTDATPAMQGPEDLSSEPGIADSLRHVYFYILNSERK